MTQWVCTSLLYGSAYISEPIQDENINIIQHDKTEMQNHESQSVMLNLYSEGAQFESWPDTE